MKTYQVILSGRANRSFKRISRYIIQHDSEEKALHVEAGLLEAIEKLTTFPHSHPILQVSKKNITYRYLLQWSYKIIFTIREDKDDVVVIELFHSKQDPEKLKELP